MINVISIVDLLKLLGLDSSLAARKALATELGWWRLSLLVAFLQGMRETGLS